MTPVNVKYTFLNNNISYDSTSKLSSNNQYEDTVDAKLYHFGMVDQYGSMALIWIPETKTVNYVKNVQFNSQGQVAKQVIESQTLHGWHSTMNTNLSVV